MPIASAHCATCPTDAGTSSRLFHAHLSIVMIASYSSTRQGGQSRGFIHGVPRVIAGSLPASLIETARSPPSTADFNTVMAAEARDTDSEFDGNAASTVAELVAIAEWLSHHRLNFNVRQAQCQLDPSSHARCSRRRSLIVYVRPVGVRAC